MNLTPTTRKFIMTAKLLQKVSYYLNCSVIIPVYPLEIEFHLIQSAAMNPNENWNILISEDITLYYSTTL